MSQGNVVQAHTVSQGNSIVRARLQHAYHEYTDGGGNLSYREWQKVAKAAHAILKQR